MRTEKVNALLKIYCALDVHYPIHCYLLNSQHPAHVSAPNLHLCLCSICTQYLKNWQSSTFILSVLSDIKPSTSKLQAWGYAHLQSNLSLLVLRN